MKFHRLIWIVAVAALAAAGLIGHLAWVSTAVHAQQPAAPASADPATVIKTETRLVLVDSVVTDKKGNYIRDLTAKDFRVWEDNKEQAIKSFSLESGSADPNHPQKRYLVLFFDNSTMDIADQRRARDAAGKFIQANASPDHLIAVVDFTGTTHIAQNFTSDADRLQKAVASLQTSHVSPNATVEVASLASPPLGVPSLRSAEADFGAHTVMLALTDLAKSLSTVPGRKTLVMLTSSFPLTPELESELTLVIDSCNRANVAVYPIDVRGLVAQVKPADGGTRDARNTRPAALRPAAYSSADSSRSSAPHLVYVAWQRTGGGGGSGGGGGGGRTGGGGGGGPVGGPGRGGGGSTGGGGGRTGGGRTGGGGTTNGGRTVSNPTLYNPNAQPRLIVPQFPDTSSSDALLYALAEGTGGFVIHNSNDLLAGLDKIAKDQDQYYVLGYSPTESPEGSCHTLKVKVDRGGTVVRSRSGYCNVKPADLLAGKPQEKELENRVAGTQPGDMAATVQVPYFYVSPMVARVDLAMEIPTSTIKFEKVKGKQHAEVNFLGIAYARNGSVAGRFSDTVNLDLDGKKEVEEFGKKPMQYENQFELASGVYTLKVAFNSGGQSFGKLEVPLSIDPYDGQHFAVSGLALSNDLRKVSELASGLDAELLADRTPLVARGMQLVPSGANRFTTKDQAAVYVEVYEPLLLTANPPKVALEYIVVDRKDGQKKMDLAVTDTDKSIQPGNPVIPLGLKLPVASLAPGPYRLEIRAVDSVGNATVTRSADFQVE
jgi:VWFA-related protein